MPRTLGRALLAVLASGLVSAVLGACGADIGVSVDVGTKGQGSVTVRVSLPKATAAEIEDLETGLPVADLRRAGWAVEGPAPGQGGATVVSATHPFSQLGQVPALVADIAGKGPVGGRPFRLAIVEHPGFFSNQFVASGVVDLRCGLSCFGNPGLAARVGYPLGLPPAALSKLFGPHPAREVTFHFEVRLPGHEGSSDARRSASSGGTASLGWSPVLGQLTSINASTRELRTAFLERLLVAVGVAALVLVMVLGYLIWRRRRRRRRGMYHRGDRRPAFR